MTKQINKMIEIQRQKFIYIANIIGKNISILVVSAQSIYNYILNNAFDIFVEESIEIVF